MTHDASTGTENGGLAAPDANIARLPVSQGLLIGSAQVLALLPGISRSGVTMVAGLLRGLSHADAARFSFLLATPVILAAGVLKIPDLFGPLGAGIHGQVLAGSVASFAAAYVAVSLPHRLLPNPHAYPVRGVLHTRRLRQPTVVDPALGASIDVVPQRAAHTATYGSEPPWHCQSLNVEVTRGRSAVSGARAARRASPLKGWLLRR